MGLIVIPRSMYYQDRRLFGGIDGPLYIKRWFVLVWRNLSSHRFYHSLLAIAKHLFNILVGCWLMCGVWSMHTVQSHDLESEHKTRNAACIYIYILCTYMMFTELCGIELFCFFNDSVAALTCWSLLIHAALRRTRNGGSQRSRRKTGRPRWWRLQQPLERSRINEN